MGTVSCYNETVGCQTHVYNSSLARHPVQAHWDGAQAHNLFYTFSSLSRPFVFHSSSLYVKTVTWTGDVGGYGQDIAHMPRISLWIQGGHLVSASPRRSHSPQCWAVSFSLSETGHRQPVSQWTTWNSYTLMVHLYLCDSRGQLLFWRELTLN